MPRENDEPTAGAVVVHDADEIRADLEDHRALLDELRDRFEDSIAWLFSA